MELANFLGSEEPLLSHLPNLYRCTQPDLYNLPNLSQIYQERRHQEEQTPYNINNDLSI